MEGGTGGAAQGKAKDSAEKPQDRHGNKLRADTPTRGPGGMGHRPTSPRVPGPQKLSEVTGSDIYARGQRFLIKKKKEEERKKEEHLLEEIQQSPQINKRSQIMMSRRNAPSWHRGASESPATRTPQKQIQQREPMLCDVVQQCITANQAVERMFSQSPIRTVGVSPEADRLPRERQRGSQRQVLARTTMLGERVGRAPSAADGKVPWNSGIRRRASSASTARSRTPVSKSTPQVKRHDGYHISGERPDFYIHRATDADSPDFFMPRNPQTSPTHDTRHQQLLSKLASHETTIEAQASRIRTLEASVDYLTLLMGVDLEAIRRQQASQRSELWATQAIWSKVVQYLPQPSVMALRLIKNKKAPPQAAEAAYVKWFKQVPKRRFRVNDHRWAKLWIPGTVAVTVGLEHVEATDSDGGEISDGGVVEAPARISIRGNGFIEVSSKGDEDANSLPQGEIEVEGVAAGAVNASFNHSRWYPLPGDGLALMAATADLPPLCPSLASEPTVLAFLPNRLNENPWVASVPLPVPAPPPGQYKLVYTDSLSRLLATSPLFAL